MNIVVTPEMVRAGVEAYCFFDEEDSWEQIVTAVFEAMYEAADTEFISAQHTKEQTA